MTKIYLHHNFIRQYRKLKKSVKKKFKERRDIFLSDPYHPILNNHPLKGKYEGYCSINIGGDLRAVYKRLNNEAILFAEIGSHSNLYE
jgi:addiction module RelE/StbE family toxin